MNEFQVIRYVSEAAHEIVMQAMEYHGVKLFAQHPLLYDVTFHENEFCIWLKPYFMPYQNPFEPRPCVARITHKHTFLSGKRVASCAQRMLLDMSGHM
jgi:hypothetical protein